MPTDMPKPTKKPSRPEMKVRPSRPDHITVEVGLLQEKLIGRVVIEWSKLENCLGDLIMRLTGLSFEDGRVFTARMDPARAIAIIRTIAPRKLDGERLQSLSDILAATDDLRDDRNFIVHGAWGTLLPEMVPTAASLRAKSAPGEITAEDFPYDRMVSIIDRIQRTKLALIAILETMPPPFDDKSE